MKVVLDTNIIVSALLSPQGLSSKILILVLDGKATIVYDNSIFAEYTDVLNRDKLKPDKELINLVIEFIAKEGEYVTAKNSKIKFPDEDDKNFYEVYKDGNIDYLITGNKKHFPNEKRIITPREFFDQYEQ